MSLGETLSNVHFSCLKLVMHSVEKMHFFEISNSTTLSPCFLKSASSLSFSSGAR